MLDQLGDNSQTDLHCRSHVTRLLWNLPPDMRTKFKRVLYPAQITIPRLLHFSDWLNNELKIRETVYDTLHETKSRTGPREEHRCDHKTGRSTSILQTTDEVDNTTVAQKKSLITNPSEKTAYCPYGNNTYHFLDRSSNFAQLTVEQITAWF